MLGFGIITYFLLGLGLNNSTTNGEFPKGFLEDITESNVVKARLNSRWKWEVWDVVPGTHRFNIYVFNLTNPKEFENGEKPQLKQAGPYSYIEHRIKFDESINLDLSVNYERNFTYTFDPSQSAGKEDDLINTINIPFIIFSTIASKDQTNGIPTINKLIKEGESLTKTNVKVGDVIFNGIDVSRYKPYLNLIGTQESWLVQEFATGSYGVLKIKRGAREGPYTVDSGLKDATQFGYIRSWNRNSILPWWTKGSTCNEIDGTTDGTVYPGNIKKSTTMNLFDIDMCRAIQFKYSKDATFRNTVDEFEFKLADDLLEDPKVATKNLCFCPAVGDGQGQKNVDNCLKKGLLDISACQQGAPYVISFAHFLNANEEYLKSIDGLIPDPKIHETTLSVQPKLGAIISYYKRFQWNLNIKPISGIPLFEKIKPIVFPILWNDDIFQLDDDKADLLVDEIANQEGGMGGGTGTHVIISTGSFMFIMSSTIIALWILQ